MTRHGKDDVKMSFSLRIKAWWEGYDTREIKERLKKSAAPDREEVKDDRPQFEVMDADTLDPWDDNAVDIAQYIWGKGFCGPGGPDYIISLSKLLALSPEMSMLQIGAGLGGPARVLADRFGVWMTGFETSRLLVERGRKLSKAAGMGKKVELVQYDPKEFEGFSRKFDRAFAKEALYTIENKRHMIEQIEERLKPGGLILITDYVLGSDAALGKERYKEWKVGERHNPLPVLADDLLDMLKSAHFQVRVSEDISRHYIDMIDRAWAGADEMAAMLAKKDNGAVMIQTLMREAQYWVRRKKLLEAGDIRLWRILANKKTDGPRGMSDW